MKRENLGPGSFHDTNIRDLTQLTQLTEEVVIIKSNEDFFCEACTLSKQHKVHSKESVNHRSEILEERLHSDIFEKDNTLSGVDEYRYDAVVIDDATRMKFSMILRTKDEICAQILIIFNQIENHTGRKIKFFRTNEGGEFQKLTLIINEKSII
jgi:predicted RNase H-like nuclease